MTWTLYNKLPTPTSADAQKTSRQRTELLRLKKEIASVSAQDDFARWAKLRRQHDKANDEYNKTTATLQASKTKFTTAVSSVRWAGMNGLRLFLLYWYSRAALFWIPREWLPGWVEWILSWPRAPVGSVSVQVWSLACAGVIGMVGEVVMAAWSLVMTGQQEKQAKELNMDANGKETPKSRKDL
ncbi:MAG: hypothetical protein Q9159_007552 [Coniocarpon cinnabarinum]